MRRWIAGGVTGALLMACSGLVGCSGGGSTSTSPTTTLPASVVDDGTATATKVIEKLTASGLPIGPTIAHPSNDPIFDAFDGLVGKVDFRDGRLLTSSSDIDENVDGGSVEAYRDERAAMAASRDRGGYVLVKGAVLLHLSSDLAPEWVIGYRDALNAAAA